MLPAVDPADIDALTASIDYVVSQLSQVVHTFKRDGFFWTVLSKQSASISS